MSADRDPTTQALIDALLSADERFPRGATYVDAASPAFGRLFSRALDADRPIVVVLPDGDEVVFEQRRDIVGRVRQFVGKLLWRRHLEAMGPVVELEDGPRFTFDLDPLPRHGLRTRLHHVEPRNPELV